MTPKETQVGTQTVDVEQIIAEIREDIKEKGYTADMLSFEDVKPYSRAARMDGSIFDPGKAQEELENMSISYYVQEKNLMEGKKFKVFFRRAIRKFMRSYVQQLVDDQNDFNAAATRYAFQVDKWRHEVDEALPEGGASSCLQRIEALEREVVALRAQFSEASDSGEGT